MSYVGIDTETIEGKARLIGLSDGSHFKIRDVSDILDFFSKFHKTNFIAFNADYDIQSFLVWLPLNIKRRLVRGIPCFIEFEGRKFNLHYIPYKFFRFGTNYIYDTYQFYQSSLKVASEKYLKKTKQDVDASNITEDIIYSRRVINYCINDARLALELFEHFHKDLPSDLKAVHPLSPAYYAGAYFRKELDANIPSKGINQLFRKTYAGGRFEVYKRGYFPKVYFYDLNSAYPFHISNLKTIRHSEGIENAEYDPEANFSCYKVRVKIRDKFLSPLMVKFKGLCAYPVGILEAYVTKPEFERLLPFKPEILNAYHIRGDGDYPFRSKIVPMYERKRTGKYKLVYKTLLNSIYGKTAAAYTSYVRKPEDNPVLDIYSDDIDEHTYYKIENYFRSNFIYASDITARTRCAMYDVVKRYPKSCIAVQTDGVMSLEPLDLPLSDSMGDWKEEIWEDVYMIGSGVYFYRKDNELQGKFRGFKLSKDRIVDIIQKIVDAKTDKVEFETKKRYSIQESLRLKDESLENQILDVLKSLNLNFDRKRVWMDSWANGKEVRSKIIESIAIPFMP